MKNDQIIQPAGRKRFHLPKNRLALVLGSSLKICSRIIFRCRVALSLGFIALILAVTIAISMLKTKSSGAAEGRK